METMKLEEAAKIKRVVVVDSQWQKAKAVLSHPNLTKLKCVRINSSKTAFWRYQHHGDEFLATIEGFSCFM
jgi:DTW domain.